MEKEPSSDNRDGKSKSQSLDRGLMVLEAIGAAETDLGVRDLARMLGIAKSIVQRLLNTLYERGFVEQEPVSRKYRIGARAFEIGSGFTRSGSLAQIATPELELLTKQHQLNSYLGILRDNTALYLATLQSSGPIAIQVSPGDRIPLHTTALGKALLFDMSDAEIRALLEGTQMERRTAKSKLGIAALIKEVRQAKALGFTISEGENIVGIYSIGAPVYDATGHIIAAISGALPVDLVGRGNLDHLSRAVVATAARISQRLGAPRRLAAVATGGTLITRKSTPTIRSKGN